MIYYRFDKIIYQPIAPLESEDTHKRKRGYMSPSTIKNGGQDIHSWLEAIEREYTPSGASTKFRITFAVKGETILLTSNGKQALVRGSKPSEIVYYGTEPEIVQDEQGTSTQFHTDPPLSVRLSAPCVIVAYGSDAFGLSRDKFHIYVRAEEAHFIAAKMFVTEARLVESESGKLQDLKRALFAWFDVSLRYIHPRGTSGGGPVEKKWLNIIRQILETGEIPEHKMVEFGDNLRAAIRKAALLKSPEERISLYIEAEQQIQTKIESEEDEAGKQFARGIATRLVEKGFTNDEAWQIIRAAGPGCVEMALSCAIKWVNTHVPRREAWDASCDGVKMTLDKILQDSLGKEDIRRNLHHYGLEIPQVKASKLWDVIGGAIEILQIGLSESFYTEEGSV